MTVRDWPALDLADGEELTLRYELGVYGKVHGAATDFRWIARSPGFDPRGRELDRQLYLGVEDRPVPSVYWRALWERYFAVGGYPSRAADDAGRTGSFEKQVIEWQPGRLPAALGALVLLPVADRQTDDIWWERRERLLDSPAALEIDRDSCPEIRVSDSDLETAIQGGRRALEEAGVTPEVLGRLYAGVLSGAGPEWFSGLAEPLAPEALAVLLLPFERRRADGLSLAGWIPSSRTDLSELGERWDILVAPPDFSQPVPKTHGVEITERARRMAAAVFELDPYIVRPRRAARTGPVEQQAWAAQRMRAPEVAAGGGGEDAAAGEESEAARETTSLVLPGRTLGLTTPSPEAGPVVRELFDYADHVAHRYLEPERLAGRGEASLLEPGDADGSAVRSWPREVADRRPEDVDREHWEFKVEILRAAALVLAPEPEKARPAAAKADTDFLDPTLNKKVPALFFLGLLSRDSLDRFAEDAEEDIELWVIHSLQVPHGRPRQIVESSLEDCGEKTRNRKLQRLLKASVVPLQRTQEELPFGR